jgi:hypothetical protein
MVKGFIKNVFNKYFSKMNPLKAIKVSLTIIAIIIYIWFFCLIGILYDFYRETIYKGIENSPVESLFSHTVGFNQPVSVIPVTIFDKIIYNKGLMNFYSIIFGALTLLIFVVLAAWFIIKNIFFISWMAYVWPFDELVEVFKIILLESPFTSFAILNLLRLLKIFLSFFKKKERFENRFDMASILRLPYELKRIYITELEKNLYNKAKQHYEKNETYMVDVMKVREHTTNAVILKNLAIIASEKDIASVSFANKATEFDITVKIAAKI